MSGFIDYGDCQFSHRLPVVLLPGNNLRLRASRNLLHPNRRVPTAVGDKSNALPIRRPSRVDVVVSPVRDRKCISTVGTNEPQLVPGLPKIRAVHQALAVRRKFGTRLPCSLLIMYLASFSAGFGLHTPEATRAIDVPPIRHENNF